MLIFEGCTFLNFQLDMDCRTDQAVNHLADLRWPKTRGMWFLPAELEAPPRFYIYIYIDLFYILWDQDLFVEYWVHIIDLQTITY